jgi:exosortase K
VGCALQTRAASVAPAHAGSRDRRRALDIAIVALALGFAFALKSFYSRAGFDELRWILDPAVGVAQSLGAGPFELEAHHGWLDRARRFEVVPACAGLNFLVVVFLSLCLGLAPARRGAGARLAFVGASALTAYAATILANGARLAIAIRLHVSGASAGPLAAGELHAAAGIAVFFVALIVVYTAASRIAGAAFR